MNFRFEAGWEASALERSLGILRFVTVAWDLALVGVCFGYLGWELSLAIFCLGVFVWGP